MTCIFRLPLVIVFGTISLHAATFVVTKAADTNDGFCDADCSLREAVAAADSASSDDVIQFNDSVVGIGQITLTLGEIRIHANGDLVIDGPPSHLFIILTNNSSRVFFVQESATVVVEGLSIKNGNGVGQEQGMGGCIMNHGKLTLRYVPVSNCHAVTSGGAIQNSGSLAELNLQNSTINANRTDGSGSFGGGIANFSNLNISDSTITGNTSIRGGGIYADSGGSATILRSTIDHNHAPVDETSNGGGIANYGNLVLENSTVCNNDAAASGGGVFNSASASISSSTICSNLAGNGPASAGGGIYSPQPGVATLRNTLIGDNLVHFTSPSDFAGQLFSEGHNVIENMSGTIVAGTTVGNIFGKDADLLPLGNYGGPTQTVSFLPTSIAIDAGDPSQFPLTDQRGIVRPQRGNLGKPLRPDIGAYERKITVFTVTKTVDTNDGTCTSDCSIREAIAAANLSPAYDDVVAFAPTVFSTPETIILILGELQLTTTIGTLFIDGPGAELLTISGNDQSRVFLNNMNSVASINGVTITHGNESGVGGGIANAGKFSLVNTILTENFASLYGGAIFSDHEMSISGCNIVNNRSGVDGAGIFNQYEFAKMRISDSTISGNTTPGGISNSGVLVVLNSTITGNNAGIGTTAFGNANSALTVINSTIAYNVNTQISGIGAGIANDGSAVFIENSTITNNALTDTGPFGGGGGIANLTENYPGTITIHNTIVANNTAANGFGPDGFGVWISQGYNLVKNTSNNTFIGVTTGNQYGVDPRLGPLTDNGGPTLTEIPVTGSPIIDAADSTVFPRTDQRSFIRPVDGDGNGTIRADIGAVEYGAHSPTSGAVAFDYDGDHKSDISVFRASNGGWYLQQSQAGFLGVQFGLQTDKIAPADYDGDGKTDVAVYRPSTGVWYVFNSSSATVSYFVFGLSEDLPTPADYDGDGKADISVFRPSTGSWYRQNTSNGSFFGIQFGTSEDKPTVGAFDGDGKADIAVFRPSAGAWYRINSSDNSIHGENFGFGSDVLAPADYDGDGKTDIAVYRPSTGIWYLHNSADSSFTYKVFGLASDIPAPADFDGDGKADITVFRPSDGTWYRQNSSNGQFVAVQFGTNGDKPTQTAFRY